MLELKIQCEDADQARIYLAAINYHNLITDFHQALRSAEKHDGNVLQIIQAFRSDFAACATSHEGPY